MRTASLLAVLCALSGLASAGACGGGSTSSGSGGTSQGGAASGAGGTLPAAGGGSSGGGGHAEDRCPSPAPTCGGDACIATLDCCPGAYCDCVDGDACETDAHCTATPPCTKLGGGCDTDTDCCEPDAVRCAEAGKGKRCCIEPDQQKAHPDLIHCSCDADCCEGTCDVASGSCG